MANRSAVLAAIAAEMVGIGGLKTIYSVAATTGVQLIPDRIADNVFPAAVLMAGESPVIPGNWERQTWTADGSVWVTDQPRGLRYRDLIDMAEPILGTYRTVSAAVKAVDNDVQSVVLREFAAVEGRQWTRGDGAPWFLVLPFTLEIKVNRSTTYRIG